MDDRDPMALSEVAILAGGLGTRLRERTGALLPKPMVPILGRPLLDYQIEACAKHGFHRILLLVHHQTETIVDHLGDGSRFGVEIRYQVEQVPRGTAGALRDALPRLCPTFLVLYGDTFFDVDLRALWNHHARHSAHATLFLHPNDHPQDSDLVEVRQDSTVIRIHPYPHPEGVQVRNLVNAGMYALTKAHLESYIPAEGKSDLAKHTFPAMLEAGCRLTGYVSPEYIKDMGTPSRLDQVSRDILEGLPERLSRRHLRRAVFLDRDGTINREVDHLCREEDLELLPGAAESIARLNRAGLLAVVATNQPVLARGELSPEGLERIHARLESLLGLDRAHLDGIYVCPHHPHKGFEGEVAALKIDCSCRKPDVGLLDRACRELGISRRGSWLVGDATTDIEAGRRAGLRTILVRTGYAGRDAKVDCQPDYASDDLPQAVDWILEGHAKMTRSLTAMISRHLDARLILIAGLSRSGKSSAAQVLRELFEETGRTAHVLPLDSWLLPARDRQEGNGVVSRYDLEGASRMVGDLAQSTGRETFDLPMYDPMKREAGLGRIRHSVGPHDLVILEGVLALAMERLSAMTPARIFVDVDEETRIARLRKYYRWRGLTDPEIDILVQSRAIDEHGMIRSCRLAATETLHN